MTVCKNCKGVGYIIAEDRYSSYHVECWECDGKGVVEPLTNEEYIRSCTFEELAGAIYEWYSAGYTTGRVGLPLNSITEIVEWLKEKHHE